LRRCAAIVESNGGSVLRSKQVDRLLIESGQVVGARLRDEETAADFRAPATILATGGFQASRHLFQKHYGENARQLLLRSNFASDGDGLRLGLEAGADTAGDMSTFYGHLIAWPLSKFAPGDFIRFALQYSDRGVLVNLDGERFTDESLLDHRSTQAVARQRHARGLLIFDESVRIEAARPVVKGMEGVDIVAEAIPAGAHVASGSLREIGARASDWGFNGARAVATVEDFNGRVVTDPESLRPPRRWKRNPQVQAPLHAIEVRPGVTFTEGGLRVDEHGNVLGRDGVIPGLYAAGADVGGIFNGGYAGGLALATVFGLTAAATAGGTRV
jgi:succinate dehydrogenase/fumarate reductase flavoprotein subunit